MPQFTVWKNPGRNSAIAYVVQIQSNRLGRSLGRVVIPLVICTPQAPPEHPLTPRLVVNGVEVFANPFDLATLPANRLVDAIATLSDRDQDKIICALDELVSRA